MYGRGLASNPTFGATVARTDKSDERSVAVRALKQLSPPSAAMLFDADTVAAVDELDRVRGYRTADARATAAVVKALNDGPPIMYTRGGGFGTGTVVNPQSSFLDTLLGLFVPVEAGPSWLPATQRYMHEQIWPGPIGSAAAYKRNGKLTTIQGVNTAVSSESTLAGVYASFRPERARFGMLGRVTIDPEISWTGRDLLDVSFVWNANIDGHIWFDYRIWTVVYQLNVATGQWDPLLSNQSARATTVAQSSWHIVGGGLTGHSGALRDGAAALSFVVEPDRTYLFGVVAELRVSHSLRRTDRQPIPQPALSDLNAYGLFKADVPAIYMSHVVLAK
jgi:hypothetical protein